MKHFKTISEFHKYRNLPAPEHPLISLISVDNVKHLNQDEPVRFTFDFYSIAVKRMSNARIRYGQQTFDFNEGIMSFMSPNQVFSIELQNAQEELSQSGWVLYIHPDFLWNTPLAKTIRQYDFWDYSVNEALFLSEKEEAIIHGMIKNIQQECQTNIDKFSKKIILTHVESLLSYADRFYHRQFITREKANHQILERLEKLLSEYFDSDDLSTKGLPSVQLVADELHISAKYLSSVLSVLTGMSTQQHIHEMLIQRAKEKLSSTELSVSEIAFALGFEHAASFSKLFKAKTNLSPLDFRRSFN